MGWHRRRRLSASNWLVIGDRLLTPGYFRFSPIHPFTHLTHSRFTSRGPLPSDHIKHPRQQNERQQRQQIRTRPREEWIVGFRPLRGLAVLVLGPARANTNHNE